MTIDIVTVDGSYIITTVEQIPVDQSYIIMTTIEQTTVDVSYVIITNGKHLSTSHKL